MVASFTMSLVWERKDGAIVFVEPREVQEYTICYQKESKCTQVVLEKGLSSLI